MFCRKILRRACMVGVEALDHGINKHSVSQFAKRRAEDHGRCAGKFSMCSIALSVALSVSITIAGRSTTD
jgi:hypothetical protein